MKEKYVDTHLVDEAIKFAVEAHAGTERRGKGFPYIIHPLEAMAIVATITTDPELLAAAALHDVVEDTNFTAEDIRARFGDRVAHIVSGESDAVIEGASLEDSWQARKQMALDHLKAADTDTKIVAMGDKLSNMRAIARDYREIGDDLWERFHSKDRKLHEWRYRGLADALKDLEGTEAYREFVALVNEIFDEEK